MNTEKLTLAFAYLRLSREEAQSGESTSITNQRSIVKNYCEQNHITIVKEFVDDGWSGGNFNRPAFQDMMCQLEKGGVNVVVTKDLSRLGRDMREASYYAEQFFPEQGIRYIAISDNFDTIHDNVLAPFQFAMNEVYLRDGSRKVKDALRSMREEGKYCACPPFGYKKDDNNKNHLVPDEVTAPIVHRIFRQASIGDSSRKIALDLTREGVITPLKYRVLYRDNFGEDGASHMTDTWCYTTVKRILRNQVYLGHTVLGKSRKVSLKSEKKINIPKQDWVITESTHDPIVSRELFDLAQLNLGRGSKNFNAYSHVRKSIFSGIVYCGECGHALCSAGSVYKGEREKYWYLTCTHKRKDVANPCNGVRIRYADLLEVVRQDLNSLISLDNEEIAQLTQSFINAITDKEELQSKAAKKEKVEARLSIISKTISKVYMDNIEGKLSDERLHSMVEELEKEASSLNSIIQELSSVNITEVDTIKENFSRFFNMIRDITHIDELDRDLLLTFVERIEVDAKEMPEGTKATTHRNQSYKQRIRIFYKFIGELSEPERNLPLVRQ